jgi:hypothetical protein
MTPRYYTAGTALQTNVSLRLVLTVASIGPIDVAFPLERISMIDAETPARARPFR